MNDKNDTTEGEEESSPDQGASADAQNPKIVDRTTEAGWITVRLQRPMKNANPEVDPSEIRIRSEVYAGDLFVMRSSLSNMENSIAVASALASPAMPSRFLARLHVRDAWTLQLVIDSLLGN